MPPHSWLGRAASQLTIKAWHCPSQLDNTQPACLGRSSTAQACIAATRPGCAQRAPSAGQHAGRLAQSCCTSLFSRPAVHNSQRARRPAGERRWPATALSGPTGCSLSSHQRQLGWIVELRLETVLVMHGLEAHLPRFAVVLLVGAAGLRPSRGVAERLNHQKTATLLSCPPPHARMRRHRQAAPTQQAQAMPQHRQVVSRQPQADA